jgi:putative Holliday junction resolvase
MTKTNPSILALDVGGQRIGVARALVSVRIASPLTTLTHDDNVASALARLLEEHQVVALVVGLPRSLDGQYTDQTRAVEAFVAGLHLDIPVYWQDEAVTSRQAREELERRGKPYAKGEVDALAATYILEDFLRDNGDKLVAGL